ncbi:MAG TPA: hypothetical protein VN887_07405 [Candidatus Angelobacter sp.]|nr:hypothetical protein [Candidatus Angelobacter sp.]
MSQLTKNKIIVYLAAIFLVGGITGAVLGWTGAKQKSMERLTPQKICARFRDRLQADLNLTPEQMRRIDPILEKRAQDMESVHDRTVKEIEDLVRSSNEEIAKVLDPSQRERLDQMEKERREFMGRRFRHRPPE